MQRYRADRYEVEKLWGIFEAVLCYWVVEPIFKTKAQAMEFIKMRKSMGLLK